MSKRLILAMLLTGGVAASPAGAQALEGRVGKLESEMRAVQRKVFPGGGAGGYVQPDIQPSDAPAGPGPGSPASSPVADLSSRVSALEQQQATLTGQIEQNQYRLRQLEDQFAAYKRATDTRLRGMEAAPAAAAVDRGDADDRPAAAPPARTVSRDPAGPRPATDPARAAKVAAVEKPSTGDGAEDGYLYGYRLWQAKLYPEAEATLKDVVATYPKSKRANFAQNLLGRSYLDDGKPSLASIAFYDNYKKYPDGERAPDSLFYLAQALLKLNKPADACKVYGELTDVYGAKISPAMKADVAKGRVTAKCS